MAPDQIEHHVVTLRALGEVLARVVDDLVRAKRTNHLDVPRAADAGHARSERLRDLHGERANATRCAVDQDVMPRLNLPLIANGGECGERRVSDRGRLFEREIGWLRQEVVLCSTRVLGEGAFAPTEHLIARSKLMHVRPDCLDLAGYVDPW